VFTGLIGIIVIVAVLVLAAVCVYFIVANLRKRKINASSTSGTRDVYSVKAPLVLPVPMTDATSEQNDEFDGFVASAGIAGETIAAISAAIALMMDHQAYTITSVTPLSTPAAPVLQNPRPVWGFAGMQHNTKPF